MIEVTNRIRVIEVDGRDTWQDEPGTHLAVLSHKDSDKLVVLLFGSPWSSNITINANELIAAIKNATNTARW